MSEQNEQSERERRMRALRSLAQDQPALKPPSALDSPSTIAAPPASATSATGAPGGADGRGVARSRLARHVTFNGLSQVAPSYRSHWLTLSAAIIIVALLATLGVVFTRQRATTSGTAAILTGATLGATPQLDGVACPSGAAISPNGAAIVIVGYQTECPSSDYANVNEPAKVVIYGTEKGRALDNVTLSLDTLAQKIGSQFVQQLQGFGFSDTPQPTILYGAPVWSSDGSRIEVPFDIQPTCFCANGSFYGFNEVGAPTFVGLLQLNGSGQLLTALTAPYSAAQQSLEWDTRQGKLVSVSGQLTPAQTYTWHGAQLVPTSPLSAAASPGPIGDPQRTASFSLWQTGWGGPVFLASGGPSPTPNANGVSAQTYRQVHGVFTLTPTFSTWSPDGRYLLLPNFNALVVIPRNGPPDAFALQSAGLSQASQIAPRDAALANLFANQAHAAPGAIVTPDALAWSPDGTLLAVAQDLPDDRRPQDQPVTLLDTRTGKTVTTLTPVVSPLNTLEFNPKTLGPSPITVHPQLAWSNDGTRLFLLNPTLGTITIWKLKS